MKVIHCVALSKDQLFVSVSLNMLGGVKNIPSDILLTQANEQIRLLFANKQLQGGDLIKVRCPENLQLYSAISALLAMRFNAIAFYNYQFCNFLVTYAASNSDHKVSEAFFGEDYYVIRQQYDDTPTSLACFVDRTDAEEFMNEQLDTPDALSGNFVLVM